MFDGFICRMLGHKWGVEFVKLLDDNKSAYDMLYCQRCGKRRNGKIYYPDCICPETMIDEDCLICGHHAKRQFSVDGDVVSKQKKAETEIAVSVSAIVNKFVRDTGLCVYGVSIDMADVTMFGDDNNKYEVCCCRLSIDVKDEEEE